ncbi:MAG: hypothetical protein RG741_06635 [Bacteroidales bacterium]|nr:hypothetical protein [Bacteroidales bacterium]
MDARKARYWIFFLALLFSRLGGLSAQTGVVVVPDAKGLYESFFSLNDSVLRSEIGSFTFTGSLLGLSGKADLREFDVLYQTDHTITLALEDIRVHLGRGPFMPSAHRLSYYGPYGYVYKIDGRYFWGFDGSVPEQRLYGVDIFFGDERYSLPAHAIQAIYEPNFCFRQRLFSPRQCHTRAFLSEDGKRIYIYMLNSRIPSLYEVCWIISEGRYIGRVVDYAY